MKHSRLIKFPFWMDLKDLESNDDLADDVKVIPRTLKMFCSALGAGGGRSKILW